MQAKDIKTSPKQRILIVVVSIFLLGASLAAYIAIIMSGPNPSSNNDTPKVDEAKVAELNAKYEEKSAEYDKLASKYSDKYFEKLKNYRSEVKGYNATTINEQTAVSTKDIKVGSGETITSSTSGYGAFYIGWCADESVFDSSFDDYENPSKLRTPLIVESEGLIEGWYLGVDGMKLGGTRVVSIPSSLAYGESQEICGGTNSPLKFLIMPIEIDDELKALSKEMNDIYMELVYAQYGMEVPQQ